ncbi:ATP-binding protein [Thermospira aquatica]|uniref:DNA binding domain-containing protein n=1 Tax=Thermospira aquatica TaxID=2828656 RepID=A0AAX3BEH6_9SPIR|nr:ATP-binding protein [Thermospira aquatica]URA10641.1 putative DNA binding domain-containing protein [Thermospira aquatica]
MENQETEYKESWHDDYLETISAFANTQGGKLIIGIDDKNEIIGVKNAKELLENLPNKIIHKLNIIPEIQSRTREGKEIIEIVIKPSSFPVSYNGRFYRRSGSTTQQLNGQELMNFLLEKSGQSWDEIVEPKASLEEIDEKAIENFIQLAKDKIPSIETETNWVNILKKLKLIESDKLKRAAILLFGKNPQDFYIQAVTRIGKFRTPTDVVSTDIIEGNLFDQLQKTLELLRTKYLISKIEYEDIHRREILEYPYEALREAIINALIHRDYLGKSQIQIRIYDDKLIIMNEGKLPPDIPVEKLKTDHISRPRNPLLARVFYYAGFIETWGRGTIKIVQECKKQGLPEPDFENDSGVMKVTLYKDIYNEENLRKMGLSERQIKAVRYVKEKGKITNKEYREISGLSDEGVRLDLNELVKKKILLSKGKGRNTYYVIGKFGD